ncbi:FAD-dependent oxidoreductase [Paenibacillus sp. 19GGS1-52]|uniref:NAD(P)/FAD-dependent oxidoreductase n=1 Tax=Paenibacillus sp. 19GGS1-52 TaxID=2758563 RepID=UPI001EFC0EBA|nr:FAD-dependent oxidoreductase [Paenibacillus sp. 19GGS1-52]ULO07103.1 FAD-dependent oxidoreductase [Paenibacillus sp. 19GGS1-52]
MKEFTCIVIGGGYAGIHAVKEIKKNWKNEETHHALRLILIDKNPFHLRKVLLFKPAAGTEDIRVPFERLLPEGGEFIQGSVTKIDPGQKRVIYHDAEGKEQSLDYELLVLTAGSVVRRPEPDQGGIALTDLEAAQKIREIWRGNLQKAVAETNDKERRRLMTIAIAGAGISGIETSAELAYGVHEDAKQLGLDPADVQVILVNANKRLFPNGPAKVGQKLQTSLESFGVSVVHESKVLKEQEGILALSNGDKIPVGLCIWTLGLIPNPLLPSIGVAVNSMGYVSVDASYRVQGVKGVYSIGDCARIEDPVSGKTDGKTCKEAIAQAVRLGKIISSDLAGRPAPSHKTYMDFFCFGLGPEQGMVWTRQWGIDLLITGKLGYRLRKYTWDMASMVNR